MNTTVNTKPQNLQHKKHRKKRFDGEGALFQSKSGRWIARRTYWDTNKDGEKTRRRYITGSGATPQIALKRLQANTEKKILSEPTETATSPRVSTLRDRWLEHSQASGTSATTRHRNRRQVDLHLIEAHGDPRAETLTQELMETLFNERLAEGTDYQRRNVYQALNPFFNYLVKQEILESNPLRNIPRPKPQKSKQLQIEEEKIHVYTRVIRAFLKYLKENPEDPQAHLYLPIKIQMLYGLRTGEVLGLGDESFSRDLARSESDAGEMTIQQQLAYGEGSEKHLGLHIKPKTKSGQIRKIPLDHQTALELDYHRATRERSVLPQFETVMFLNPKTLTPYHPKKWTTQINEGLAPFWKETTEKKPLPFRAHLLRHISATMLYENKVPLETIKAILGHSTDLMSLHYTHQTKTAKQEAVNTLSDLI